jgi:hypothetical protein
VVVVERHLGTPQGGSLSPLLVNVLLDEVDRALETRGHSFARYADDCNVYVGSIKAGERVMAYLRKLYTGATEDAARQVAGNYHRRWRNSRGVINTVLTIAYFDRLGVPRLS